MADIAAGTTPSRACVARSGKQIKLQETNKIITSVMHADECFDQQKALALTASFPRPAPEPAKVIAFRYTASETSPAKKIPG